MNAYCGSTPTKLRGAKRPQGVGTSSVHIDSGTGSGGSHSFTIREPLAEPLEKPKIGRKLGQNVAECNHCWSAWTYREDELGLVRYQKYCYLCHEKVQI